MRVWDGKEKHRKYRDENEMENLYEYHCSEIERFHLIYIRKHTCYMLKFLLFHSQMDSLLNAFCFSCRLLSLI